MSTAEKPAKPTMPDHIQLDEWERAPEGRRPELTLPDHTQLPDRDGTFVQNFQELPQSLILTDSIQPVLRRLHADGRYLIGQDCGIYWRLTDPPLNGAKAPDWFYVPDVPPMLEGRLRRSYVLWQEIIPPLIVLEYVSGNGSEERDRTPYQGKFWVYEHAIRPAFYGIYEVNPGRIEMYHLVEGRYERLPANAQGRYPINGLGVELGIWRGLFHTYDLPWMRWWDAEGNLLLTGHEIAEKEADRAEREADRAEREADRAEREADRAEREADRAERLAAQLRALGIEPEG